MTSTSTMATVAAVAEERDRLEKGEVAAHDDGNSRGSSET